MGQGLDLGVRNEAVGVIAFDAVDVSCGLIPVVHVAQREVGLVALPAGHEQPVAGCPTCRLSAGIREIRVSRAAFRD